MTPWWHAVITVVLWGSLMLMLWALQIRLEKIYFILAGGCL